VIVIDLASSHYRKWQVQRTNGPSFVSIWDRRGPKRKLSLCTKGKDLDEMIEECIRNKGRKRQRESKALDCQ
jgi:hypothetical protein